MRCQDHETSQFGANSDVVGRLRPGVSLEAASCDSTEAHRKTYDGASALLVAGLGLYSVLSYLVVQRTHEIGVRMALGAGGRQIMALVLRDSLVTASVGVVLGVAAAWYAGRYLEGLLFETSPHDPGVLCAAALTLLGAATAAALLPALRARRVDPMRALSAE